jgi:subtilisin family serine protease
LVLLALCALLVAATPGASAAGFSGRYIVVLADAAGDPAAIAAEHARAHGAAVSYVYRHALRGYAATIPTARLASLRMDPRVAFISEDREVHAVAQSLPTGIDRIDADQSGAGDGTGSVNVDVAIIDTGIDLDHPDLNVVGGKNCVRGRPSYNDGNGHGTHVAGTIGAKDNADGVVGVAPGARLWAVRVLDNSGSGSWSSVICGIDFVTANASTIEVANMSLGGSGSDGGSCATTSQALQEAICNSVAAGVFYAVAAGNSNADLKGFVPAAYDQVLSVTAVADFNGQPGGGAAPTCRSDVDDTAADFSNYATLATDQAHTIAAPGVCILSTWKGGGYNTISGTSMASPHVAGAAALCIGTGLCADPSGATDVAALVEKLRTDAAIRDLANDYGFAEDPNSTSDTSRYYGYLLYAGAY